MNAAHIHLITNHAPLFGALIGVLILIVGMIRNTTTIKKTALWVLLFGGLVAIPAFLSGEPAEEVIENTQGISKSVIHEHEEAGELALIVSIALGLLSALALWLYRGTSKYRTHTTVLVLVCGLAVCVIMAWTSNLGGEIRHPEIRGDSALIKGVPLGVDADDDH